MFDVLGIPLLLQIVVPASLLAWVELERENSRASWLIKVAACGAYLVTIALAGLWLAIPLVVPVIYLALFGAVVWRSSRRARDLPLWPRTLRPWVAASVRGALAASAVGLALHAGAGHRAPRATSVDLSFPLRSGTYLVVNGGSNNLVSAHMKTVADQRFRAWRGQSYGVDLVRLGGWGLRARGLLPAAPEAYAIYGDSVFAPRSGRVVAAVTDLADLKPPSVDRTHMAGNHVLLESGAVWILLGHLRPGTVHVHAGDSVARGQYLGQVGNTGNTNEPHLHIHAQLPGTAEEPFSGAPIPIAFGGRYLARNALIGSEKRGM